MNKPLQYVLAALLPMAIAALTWSLHGLVSAANVALLYLFIVVVTAIFTSTRPALLSAVVSFIAFTLSYTEPQGTLLVMHRQDLLMILLFLLVAVIVGPLAGRLREQLLESRARQAMGEIQIEYTARLASAMTADDVLLALRHALNSIPDMSFQLQKLQEGEPDWDAWDGYLQAETRAVVHNALELSPGESTSELYSEDGQLCVLHDGVHHTGLLLISRSTQASLHVVRLMAHQATNALKRIRLASELKSEQQERENELIRSSLLSSLSHDFRTPLTSMVGASTTLLELGEQLSEAERRELLQSILDESRRLNSFTEKLLDMAQLGRGRYKLNRTTIAIDELIHAALKRVRQLYDQEFILDLQKDIPAIEVHTALIEQALYNVIENACKFTQPDQPITIQCRAQQDALKIVVEDHGPGIPDAEKTQVFEMFHSANRGDRRVAGSGLGLAISKGMVAAHGGNIEISDCAGHSGCRVEITLPVDRNADTAEQQDRGTEQWEES